MKKRPEWVDDPQRPGFEVTPCRVTGTAGHKMSCYCEIRRRPKVPPVTDPRKKEKR